LYRRRMRSPFFPALLPSVAIKSFITLHHDVKLREYVGFLLGSKLKLILFLPIGLTLLFLEDSRPSYKY
jgi:hypothetical protein